MGECHRPDDIYRIQLDFSIFLLTLITFFWIHIFLDHIKPEPESIFLKNKKLEEKKETQEEIAKNIGLKPLWLRAL